MQLILLNRPEVLVANKRQHKTKHTKLMKAVMWNDEKLFAVVIVELH